MSILLLAPLLPGRCQDDFHIFPASNEGLATDNIPPITEKGILRRFSVRISK
jgi:hypothetical protein